MVSNLQEITITFDDKKYVKIESLGPLVETINPCQIQYKSTKFQQAQIVAEPTKRIVGFEKDTELKPKIWNHFSLTDVSITVDNKLIFSYYTSLDPKLYIFSDFQDNETEITFSSSPFGCAVMPGTDRAVVTLPEENSIEFINTLNMTKGGKVEVEDLDVLVSLLDVTEFTHEQLIAVCSDELLCVKLDGTLVYSKDGERLAGRRGKIYFNGYITSNIQRMSPDGKNCEEIINKDDGINLPSGMCFNNDFTKLFVIINGYTSVSVYNCRY
ncbi:unnamed protein product [Mytilus coruscus]|uniref:Uncharacterized protein n=1 Tax=Mytilus coruscus TaxID=42192 RepID=A0A6J8AKE3_MYTCO|nr:unnamed protein product [Mytilus coruscus]